jgi:hypothetical protein
MLLKVSSASSSSSSSDDPIRVSSVEVVFWLLPAWMAASLLSRSSKPEPYILPGELANNFFFLDKILIGASEAFLYSFTMPAGAFLTWPAWALNS